jgi:hypothetical protein
MDKITENEKTLPGFGSLLSLTWKEYKKRVWIYAAITALPAAFSIISQALGHLRFLILPAVFFFGLWSSVSLLFAVKEREKAIGFKESYKMGWRKLLPYFWTSLFLFLAIASGFFLFLIPGIIFSVWFVFSLYVLVAEGKAGKEALKRSKELVKGFWWSIFWRFLLIMLSVVFLTLLFSVPFSLLFGEEGQNFSSQLISIFTSPFVVVYSFLLYQRLKEIKEKADFSKEFQKSS